MEAHYVRGRSKRQFLASNLNIHTMYELYELCMDINPKVWEQFTAISLIPALTWVFTNPKKIVVVYVLSLKTLLRNS